MKLTSVQFKEFFCWFIDGTSNEEMEFYKRVCIKVTFGSFKLDKGGEYSLRIGKIWE